MNWVCRRSSHEFSKLPRGLVLVTGPTGSGKSTTLAAIIDKINKERPVHIITVEDPIEYLHRHQLALVNQREVYPTLTHSRRRSKYALREDPDVVLVGEMRDLETIEAALSISETGHLAFATLHTNSCAETINRIVDVFPTNQQEQIRVDVVVYAAGGRLADADPQDRRRPRNGAGDHDRNAGDSRHHSRRQSSPDIFDDSVGPEVRHEDDESVTGRTVSGREDHASTMP